MNGHAAMQQALQQMIQPGTAMWEWHWIKHLLQAAAVAALIVCTLAEAALLRYPAPNRTLVAETGAFGTLFYLERGQYGTTITCGYSAGLLGCIDATLAYSYDDEMFRQLHGSLPYSPPNWRFYGPLFVMHYTSVLFTRHDGSVPLLIPKSELGSPSATQQLAMRRVSVVRIGLNGDWIHAPICTILLGWVAWRTYIALRRAQKRGHY